MRVSDCRLIDLQVIHDHRGNIAVVEGAKNIPFDIKRTYHLFDVPGGTSRGGHAHRTSQQFIVAMSGSFDIHVDDGVQQQSYSLNRSYVGLLIPNMIWRVLDNFSSGAVCLSLSSAHFDEADYYRDYDEFSAAAAKLR